MMIKLTEAVKVPVGDGTFATFGVDDSVNYSCKKTESGNWHHEFSAYHSGLRKILRYVTIISGNEPPSWLRK